MKVMRVYWAPLVAIAYLFSFLLAPVAGAGMLGTQAMVDQQARQASVERVHALLSEDRMQEQMIALGVDPADAKIRVASLNAAELAHLEGKLEELPAGGVLAVLGVVFVVLLVLELVGVTNIFSQI